MVLSVLLPDQNYFSVPGQFPFSDHNDGAFLFPNILLMLAQGFLPGCKCDRPDARTRGHEYVVAQNLAVTGNITAESENRARNGDKQNSCVKNKSRFF